MSWIADRWIFHWNRQELKDISERDSNDLEVRKGPVFALRVADLVLFDIGNNNGEPPSWLYWLWFASKLAVFVGAGILIVKFIIFAFSFIYGF